MKHSMSSNSGEQLNLGSRQLQRKVRAITGKTPSDIIRIFRLQRARDMLNKRAGTVTEVAYAVGFSNLSYFAKSFKNEFGMTPSEALNQSAKND